MREHILCSGRDRRWDGRMGEVKAMWRAETLGQYYERCVAYLCKSLGLTPWEARRRMMLAMGPYHTHKVLQSLGEAHRSDHAI